MCRRPVHGRWPCADRTSSPSFRSPLPGTPSCGTTTRRAGTGRSRGGWPRSLPAGICRPGLIRQQLAKTEPPGTRFGGVEQRPAAERDLRARRQAELVDEVRREELAGQHRAALADDPGQATVGPVSYTHLRAHETDSYLVCRLLL